MDLRPYQLAAIQEARGRLRAGASRVLLIIPTGGGKTIVAAEIIRSAVAKGSRILFLAHRRELITQTADKLTRFGVRFGIIMPGWPRALHHQVQVASVQTLIRHPELLQRVDLVFVDEAHHASAASYQKLLSWWPGAKVVGLTATPWRQDGEGLADLFDSYVIGCTPRQLRDLGFLCPVGGWEYEAVDTSGARVRGGDFAQQDLAAAARSTTVMGDVVKEWTASAGGARTVLFAINVEHSQHLVQAFQQEGVPAEHVDGEMPVEERDAVLARFRSGQTVVVSNCNVLTEGWDCLDRETEILTPAGWRGMGQLQLGDEVYSLNRVTERMEVTPVESYVERELRPGERMFTVRSQHTNIRTTEGHQFHVKYRDPARAGSLSAGFITRNGTQLVGRRSAYALPLAAELEGGFPGVPLTDDELRFVAWFMTDGGFERSDVAISQAKSFRDEIRALLLRLGFSFRERVREARRGSFANAAPLHVFSVPKRSWSRLQGYLSKEVAPGLQAMDRRQFSVFWAELLKGDGWQRPGASGWLWCNRKAQVDAYLQLAILRGFSASYTEQLTANGKTVYVVSVRDRQWLTSDPADRRAAKLTLEAPEPGERVWCVRNRNSTLVTRRRGKVAIIGNCPEAEIAVLCRPTLSTSLYLQMVGRVLRPAPGKARARIHDHAGCLATHGHPYADRDYSPEHSSGGSRRAAEEREAIVKRCPTCKSVLARWPCDGCGYQPTYAELQAQYRVEEARRKEIGNDPAAAPPALDPEVERRRERWRARYRNDAERRKALFERFVQEVGLTRAKSRYRWFSGELEWPPRAWSEAVQQLDAFRGSSGGSA